MFYIILNKTRVVQQDNKARRCVFVCVCVYILAKHF